MKKIRWGILGAGRIAKAFADAINATKDAELYAVASRSLEKATMFKNTFHAQIAYGSYEELAEDSDIDVIYIATPHSEHRNNAFLCINAGRNVLCEKPIAPNAKQAKEILELATQKNVFLMEAIWTKFNPTIRHVLQWIKERKIGEPRLIDAGFCCRSDINPNDRLYDPALAGGALLDVGVYPLNLASFVLGYHPTEITGFAHIGSTGVDEQGTALLKYEGGALASLSFAIRTQASEAAMIYGTEGHICIPHFWKAQSAELWKNGVLAETCEHKFRKNGYEYEIEEVCECLRSGKTGSDIAPMSDTIAILEITDQLRQNWGERYPFE